MEHEHLHSAVADFSEALGQLVRRIRASSAGQGVSLTQIAAMGRLHRDGPATISDLARAEGVKPQSMGASIAMLEEMGCVERRPHSTDGRQVIIALTPKGSAMRDEIRSLKRSWLAQAIAELDEQEQTTLFAATAIIRRLGGL